MGKDVRRMASQPQSVSEALDKVVGRDGITGAVCLDGQGFTLGNRGELLAATQTAHLAGVADGCARLEPNSAKTPVITIETSVRTISVQGRDGLITAVVRKP